MTLSLGAILTAVVLLVVYLLAGLLSPNSQEGILEEICSTLGCGAPIEG
ncbi:hypothetical protein J7I93_13885 [Bacillus sp. ISL-47]|nr:hypothetical protein [Bacillus sp. ISL-47]MBT2689278.1 hypothetical protein [Bacillus sp. ISL-47]MBT2707169.1 hypothetical protein [Pseudomonas sp. ISL-84]